MATIRENRSIRRTREIPSKTILPPKYYLDYFNDLLSFVEKMYPRILSDHDHDFIQSFKSLTEQSQCLFIRLSNRKGPYFRFSKIRYEEIPDTTHCFEELLGKGFISTDIEFTADFYRLFLKSELIDHCKLSREYIKTNIKKIITELLQTTDDHRSLLGLDRVVKVEKQENFEFLKFLYFGTFGMSMTEFVLKDIGNVKLEKINPKNIKPWCTVREEAVGAWNISVIRSNVKTLLRNIPVWDIHHQLDNIDWDIYKKFAKSQLVLDKLAIELGTKLEREGHLGIAMGYYGLSIKPPSRERQIRIFEKLSRREKAMRLAESILENPQNASEQIFANDFLRKKDKKMVRSTHLKLATARKLTLSPTNDKVEKQVLKYFEQKGWQGFHCENYVWRNLYGLVFWDVLYDAKQNDVHHPLQRISPTVYMRQFFVNNKRKLVDRLDRLKNREDWEKEVNVLLKGKCGITNPFVNWHPNLFKIIKNIIGLVDLSAIKSVLLEICKSPKENCTGFPDLFIWKDKDYYFYEVKSPNDQLSPQQLFWMDFFKSKNINIDIIKVCYPTSIS